MNPVDDRELLWRAWPDGYLAMRGVQTVGHWQCRWAAMDGLFAEFILATGAPLGSDGGLGDIRRLLVSRGFPRRGDEGEHARGDLLPLVSLRDPATWACLMQDLVAAASGVDVFDGVHATLRPLVDTTWGLEWRTTSGIYGTMQLELNETPLSLPRALVLARIQLRNKAAEASSRRTP